jgi:hypothetical protein
MQFQHKPLLSRKEINKFKTSQGGKKYLTQSKKSLEYKVFVEVGVVVVALYLFYV